VVVKYTFCFSKDNSISLTTLKVSLSVSVFFLDSFRRIVDNNVRVRNLPLRDMSLRGPFLYSGSSNATINITKFAIFIFYLFFNTSILLRVVKSRRMRWAGHVARMGEERVVHRVL
jgi:hypothetical protein